MTPATRAPQAERLAYTRKIPPPSGNYEWMYLWELPLRLMHWLAAIAVVVLVVTGLFIGRPYFMPSGDPSSAYLMGTVRFVHFVAAAVLVMTAIVRTYWLFMGNRFERLAALFPLRRRDLVNLWKTIRFYLLIDVDRAPKYLGHNPLQQLSYTALYGIAALSVITGFAMYGQSNPDGLIFALFNWVNALFGGEQIVRFTHHVLTWLFLTFIPIHVYLALRADSIERSGTVSSIVSGGRFVARHEEWADAG